MNGEEILEKIRKCFAEASLDSPEDGFLESGSIVLFDTSWMGKEKLLKALEREFSLDKEQK